MLWCLHVNGIHPWHAMLCSQTDMSSVINYPVHEGSLYACLQFLGAELRTSSDVSKALSKLNTTSKQQLPLGLRAMSATENGLKPRWPQNASKQLRVQVQWLLLQLHCKYFGAMSQNGPQIVAAFSAPLAFANPSTPLVAAVLAAIQATYNTG